MGKSCTARCYLAICSFRHCFIGAHLFAIVDDKRRDIFCDAVAELGRDAAARYVTSPSCRRLRLRRQRRGQVKHVSRSLLIYRVVC
jgi:hypothetical protein